MIDYTITSVETITAFDTITGGYMFTLDELQNATIAQGQEVTPITGKQGRKLSSLKRNKTVTISGTNGLLSNGLIEMQTGNAFESKVTEVLWTDYLTISGNATATQYTAIGTTGAEIENLLVKNADGVADVALVQGATAAAATADSLGVFTYDPATRVLGFSAGAFADGTEIAVYYKRKIQTETHTNMSDSYSSKCQLYVDALAEDKCGNIYRVQIYIPKADFNGEFSIEMGDNQAVHSFEAESLAGSCGNGGSLWTFSVFGVNAADVA